MNKNTILIVEDDLGLMELISEKIQECGYETHAVSSAGQAFSWLKDHSPLFMLLDYSLPDMNGKEFLTHLNSAGISVPPFVIATGQGDERVAVDLMKLGAKDYIIKDSHFLEMIPVVVGKISNEIENEQKLRLTESALDESNQFNKQIIESAQEGIVVYDKNLKYVIWNPFMEQLTGMPAQNVIGNFSFELFPFLIDSGTIKNLERAIQFEEINEIDLAFNIPISGKSGWLADKTAPFYNNKGEVIGAISTVHDISERKEAEKALAESETKYRELVDNSPDAIAIYTEGIVVFVNNECLRLMAAKSANELLGKNVIEFVHPEYRSFVIERMTTAVIEGKSLPLAEEKFIRMDGTSCDVNVKAIPIRFNNKPSVQLIVRDITENKLVERALSESEELYRSLVFRIPDGVYKSTREGKFVDVNPALIKMLGYDSKEELMEVDIKTQLYFDLTDRESLVLKENNEEIGIFRLRKKDGTAIWIEDHGWYNIDVNGEVLTHEGVLRDITERKMAEFELDKSQKEFKELFDNAPVGYHEIDSEGRIVLINQTELNMLGYSLNELIGRFVWEISASESESIKAVKAKLKGRNISSSSFSRDFRRKDGSVFPVLVQDKIRYDIEGNISGVRSTVQDYTELKNAEKLLLDSQERYRLALQATRDGLWERNLVTNQSIYSARWCEIIGYSDDDPELPHTFQSWAERIHPDDYERVINALNIYIEKGTRYDVEYRHLHKSGEYRWQNSMGTSVLDEDGKPVKIVGCISDINERKNAEEALRTSEDKYRTMIENSNDLIWTLDKKGNFVFMNEVALKRTELKLNDLIGKSFSQLIISEDLPLIIDVFNRSILGELCNYELRLKKPDNSILTLSVNTSPIYNSGRIEGIVSFARDVTEQKLAEQAINEYMDNLIRFQNLTVDRELAMINLKKEINEMLINSGKKAKYKIVE